MITTTDIANILYADCASAFGISTFQEGNIRKGKPTEEFVKVHAKEQTPERIWDKGFVEVNIVVPDDINGKASLIRLNELERKAKAALKKTGIYDGTRYTYGIAQISVLQDRELESHYVNARILFKSLNVL